MCFGFFVHQDLRSFPTRRSSDLDDLRRGGELPMNQRTRTLGSPSARRSPAVPSLPPELEGSNSCPTGADRKSTRLNSSHGYISYAVFRLKKKNERSETLPEV